MLLLAAVTLVVGCTTSISGRKQLILVSEKQAISSSKRAYFETIEPLKKEGKVNTDSKVSARVKAITDKLIQQAILLRPETKNWEWQINVIEDPQVNAWCMAGGKMAVYTGLLKEIKPTDDELAQVLGHEISHALANHTAERMSVAMASSLGLAVLGMSKDSSELTIGAAAVAAKLAVELPNSRAGESEADKIGIELAAKAGYNPDAAVSLWQKMGALNGSKVPQFLQTHPSPKNRQNELRKLAKKVRPFYLSAIGE